jgi:hypothetical protein
MFSVITNIYNKETKGPTLMQLFTATGKLEKFFFYYNRDVRCVHHGWHGTHRYDIQVLAHTLVNMGALIFLSAAIVDTTHEWSCLWAGPLRTLHEMHFAQ